MIKDFSQALGRLFRLAMVDHQHHGNLLGFHRVWLQQQPTFGRLPGAFTMARKQGQPGCPLRNPGIQG